MAADRGDVPVSAAKTEPGWRRMLRLLDEHERAMTSLAAAKPPALMVGDGWMLRVRHDPAYPIELTLIGATGQVRGQEVFSVEAASGLRRALGEMLDESPVVGATVTA